MLDSPLCVYYQQITLLNWLPWDWPEISTKSWDPVDSPHVSVIDLWPAQFPPNYTREISPPTDAGVFFLSLMPGHFSSYWCQGIFSFANVGYFSSHWHQVTFSSSIFSFHWHWSIFSSIDTGTFLPFTNKGHFSLHWCWKKNFSLWHWVILYILSLFKLFLTLYTLDPLTLYKMLHIL